MLKFLAMSIEKRGQLKTIRGLDLAAVQQLEGLYESLRVSLKGFPDAHCVAVSEQVAGLGFKYQEGSFKLDVPKDGRLHDPHAWCTDAKGTIIDLTAAQFNRYLVDVQIPQGVLIVGANDPLRTRFKGIKEFARDFTSRSA